MKKKNYKKDSVVTVVQKFSYTIPATPAVYWLGLPNADHYR